MQDLDDIRIYLQEIPLLHALRVVQQLQVTLHSIGVQPMLGVAQSELTRLLGQEVRSRLTGSYRLFYRLGSDAPEIFAILHTARDPGKPDAIEEQ